jgi:geranylgeranylglycerol-phosphate geranylgeranyltransferase
MVNKKIAGLYRLFRFELSFTAGACVLLGEILAKEGMPTFIQASYGFLNVFFIAATALILNDYFDIETDRINSPHRPLPSGLVTKNEALILSIIVALLGFLFALFISVEAFFVVFLVWFVGFLYNWRFKKTGLWGNLFVGFSVGMTFIVGGIIVGNPFEITVWYFALTTMFVDLGEEIAADSLDVEGDRKTGSRSLAVLLGPHLSMKISAAIFTMVVAGSIIPFIFGWFEWFYLPPILLWVGIIVYSTKNLLDNNRLNRINDIRRIYLGGLAMLIVFIAIKIFVDFKPLLNQPLQ